MVNEFDGAGFTPEELHEELVKAYNDRVPLLYDVTFCVGDERYRLDVRRYPDRIGCGITRLFDDSDDAGMTWDFPSSVIEPLVSHLGEIRRIIEAI